jgi:hypothetical protein
MDIDKAAKYLIVAWIKNWRMRTLLDAVDEHGGAVTQERVDRIHAQFPFMPNIIHAYISSKGSGILMRPYVANLSKKLSDALWDTDDNTKKLSYYTYVKTLKANKLGKMQGLSKEENAEKTKDLNTYRASVVGYRQSRDIFKLAQGRDWFTVK